MKKLNNKGFAISTVLYAVLIMIVIIITLIMGIMQTNRKNTHDLVDQIEDELNRFSLKDTSFNSIDDKDNTITAQEYIVPFSQSGWYKIELWGSSSSDSKGSYTTGLIKLTDDADKLYFYIGKNGKSSEVRLINGSWNDPTSKNSTIMKAAGGIENKTSNQSYILNSKKDKIPVYFVAGKMGLKTYQGKGHAKIEFVAENPERNSNFDNVQYIRDCIYGIYNASDAKIDQKAIWKDIKAISSEGEKLGYTTVEGKINTEKKLNNNKNSCFKIKLNKKSNLDEIAILHTEGKGTYKHQLSVSSDGSNWKNITSFTNDKITHYDRIEKINGTHYSAYDKALGSTIPNGTYYILPACHANYKALTSINHIANSSNDNLPVTIQNIGGLDLTRSQSWLINSVSSGKYKIVEEKSNYALQLLSNNTDVTTSTKYNNTDTNHWKIESLNDGTYKIKSAKNNGYLFIDNIAESPSSNIKVKTSPAANDILKYRWIIIKAK